MNDCQLREAREAPAALRRLYHNYRESLPKCKQTLVAPNIPPHLLDSPGIVCFQDELPAVAFLWKESVPGIVAGEFYAEAPGASRQQRSEERRVGKEGTAREEWSQS